MSDSIARTPIVDDDPDETHEWLESLEYAMAKGGPKRVRYLLDRLEQHARFHQVDVPFDANTPYVNTIPVDQQPAYPGDREIERRIKSIVRWNAMAIVVRAWPEPPAFLPLWRREMPLRRCEARGAAASGSAARSTTVLSASGAIAHEAAKPTPPAASACSVGGMA